MEATKVGVNLKIITDDKKNTNLLSRDTVTIRVSKSSTLQDAILRCIKENSTISEPSEASLENISDVYFEKKDGEQVIITDYIEQTLTMLETEGFKFGLLGYTYTVTMKLKKTPSQQSKQINHLELIMTTQNTKSYLVPAIPNIHLPFLKGQSDFDEAASDEALEKLHALQIDEQVKCLLCSYLEQLGFGYSNNEEKKSLEKFIDLYSKTLLFVERVWKSLFKCDFPSIPSSCSEVKSLQLLKLTDRKK